MEFLQSILDNSTVPAISAAILGLLTAISPCPLATNITAIGYIGRDIGNPRSSFVSGLMYTFGRILTYSILGAVLIAIIRTGESIYGIQDFIGKYAVLLLPPLLIATGLIMLGIIKFNIPGIRIKSESLSKAGKHSWGALLLGTLFALAFCPTSGILFFGMLIPQSVSVPEGYILPVIYAVATGLPVILVAWVISFSFSGIGKLYNNIKLIETWLSRIVAAVFIVVGIYYAVTLYF